MGLGRRRLLSCVLLPGSLTPWCGETPVAFVGREWTGYPPDPRVSGWHRLGYADGDASQGMTWWWDASVMAWRERPDEFRAFSAAELRRDDWVYRGPRAAPEG